MGVLVALPFALDIDDLERPDETPGEVHDAPRYCKITLAADAPGPITLAWNPGKGPGSRSSVQLKPGESMNEILYKAEVWFGPFTMPERFRNASNEKDKNDLRKFWQTERKRVLDRYDYPRLGGKDADMTPVGPHRFPDVTCTVIEPDGTEHEPIRLHELYRIGEFDSITFETPVSVDEVRAEYESKLASKDEDFKKQMATMQAQIAALNGQLSGFISGLQAKDAVLTPSASAADDKAAKPVEAAARRG